MKSSMLSFLLIATWALPNNLCLAEEKSEEGRPAKKSRQKKSDSATIDQTEAQSEDANKKLVRPDGLIPVEFYRPEISGVKGKNAIVLFSGRTTPNSNIMVQGNRIPVFVDGGGFKYIKIKKAYKSSADTDGFFKLKMVLPQALIQLPIQIKTPTGQAQSFQINLMIKKEDIEMQTKDSLVRSPLFKEKYGIWVGTGFNYLIYNQTINEIPSELKFPSFRYPSYYMRFNFRPHDRWLMNFEYKRSPGSVSIDSEELALVHGNYNWDIISLETNYTPGPWRRFEYNPWGLFSLFSNRKFWGEGAIRFGFQHHTVPVLNRIIYSPQTSEVETNTIDIFALGAQLTVLSAGNWGYELYMKYQYPFQSGAKFKVKPQYAIDGSVGTFYRSKKHWRLGLFWYGQWQNYKFSGLEDIQKGPVTGSQSLFFSNAELRLGWEW